MCSSKGKYNYNELLEKSNWMKETIFGATDALVIHIGYIQSLNLILYDIRITIRIR